MDVLLTVIVPIFVGDGDEIIERMDLPVIDTPDGVEFIFVCAIDDRVIRNRVESKIAEMGGNVTSEFIRPSKGLFSLSRARNVGAKRARGRLLLFWDVDLFAHSRFYDRLFGFIDSRKLLERQNLFFPIPAVYLRPLSIERARSEYRDIVSHDDLLFGDGASGVEGIHRISSAVLVNRDFYLAIGGQYEGFEGWGYEDWHFLWKLLLFPHPIPEPSEKDKPAFEEADYFREYRSWRAAAEMLGEEAFRANLYCYHAHHLPRNDGWKTRKSDNRILFDKLTSARRLEINFEPNPDNYESRKPIEIYSRCPSVANRLYYPPTSNPRVFDLVDLKRRVRSRRKDVTEIELVLGGISQASAAIEAATWLIKRSVCFRYVAPTGLSSRNIMLDFDGMNFNVHVTDREDVNVKERLHMEAGGLEYVLAADAYRAEIGATGSKMILMRMSDVRIAKQTDSRFGVEDEEIRSFAYGLAPLFGKDVVFVIYDPRNKSNKESPFDNLFYAGGRDVQMLYEAADLVVTQSPFDIWQGLIRGRPVATTGSLVETMVDGVPVVSGVEELYRWIQGTDGSIPVEKQDDYLHRLEKISSAFVLTEPNKVEPEKLAGHHGGYRVMYEKVNHSLYRANYKFAWDSWERRMYYMVNPKITKHSQMKFHREIDHDFALFRRLTRAKATVVQLNVVKPSQGASKPDSGTDVKDVQKFAPSGQFVATPDSRLGLVKNGPGTLGRKLRKFRRDPYRYFADAKSPVVRPLKNLFAR